MRELLRGPFGFVGDVWTRSRCDTRRRCDHAVAYGRLAHATHV